MKNLKTQIIFWLLVATFVYLLMQFFVPMIRNIMQGKQFLIPIAIFFILGILLIIFTLREKITGKPKIYLLLTGISAVGFFSGVILHNIVSALLTMLSGREFEEPIFFLLAIIIAPITFLIGMIGSIVLIIKKK
ncbi:hypothetical protein KKA15_04855 [Patescibacteria group bacterium]|nr:hypothetical protein [Patescibacteria group bacterium]